MKIIQKVFETTNEGYYNTHLNIINCILPVKLTNKEIDVLSSFMEIENNIIQHGYFNPVSRKIVMTKLKLDAAGLSNHITSMIKKGFLVKNAINNAISIKEFLLPEENKQGYQFKLIKK